MPLFPLLVDERITHVVWYEAADQVEAVKMASGDPATLHECFSTRTRADIDLTVYAPETDWEHALVKEPSSFGYPGETAAA